MSVTAQTIVVVVAGVAAIVAIVGGLAFRLGRAAGFDDGVKAARTIEQSAARGAARDRAH